MKNRAFRRNFLPGGLATLVLLAAWSFVNTSVEARANPDVPEPLAALSWLAGDWHTRVGDAGALHIEEHWLAPVGDKMVGMGRTVKGGRTQFFEYIRIEARVDGIYYVAQPGGIPPTDFKLTSPLADLGREAVFENPEHDFPKRITYRRNEDGSITARVDGGPESTEPAEVFNYTPGK